MSNYYDAEWKRWCKHQDKIMDMMSNMSVANPPPQSYIDKMLLPTHQLGSNTVYSAVPVPIDPKREKKHKEKFDLFSIFDAVYWE